MNIKKHMNIIFKTLGINGAVCTAQLLYFMFFGLFEIIICV